MSSLISALILIPRPVALHNKLEAAMITMVIAAYTLPALAAAFVASRQSGVCRGSLPGGRKRTVKIIYEGG